ESQTRSARSTPTEASKLPSGEKARAVMFFLWAFQVRMEGSSKGSFNRLLIVPISTLAGKLSTAVNQYNSGMDSTDPLSLFVPPVGEWFRATLGEPTAPQREGWPAIPSGQHPLILAPTGSGKTLAAFLACLDTLWRQTQLSRGVQVLYVSPLKALNNDIHRNLQAPLEGVAATAR